MNSFKLFDCKDIVFGLIRPNYFSYLNHLYAPMGNSNKNSLRKMFGQYLKNHRETVLKEKNLLVFSYGSNLDNSKLAKIEKGEIDIQFDTLIEVAKTYKLASKTLFGFELKKEFLDK